MVETGIQDYEFCRRCLAGALDLLYSLRDDRLIPLTDIRHRCRQLAILRRQRFEQLQKRFLPPLDHQDLWRLYTACEDIHSATANALSELHRQRATHLSRESCQSLLPIIDATEALQSALISFPAHKRSTATADHLLRCERCIRQADEASFRVTAGKSDVSLLRLQDALTEIGLAASRAGTLLHLLMLQY